MRSSSVVTQMPYHLRQRLFTAQETAINTCTIVKTSFGLCMHRLLINLVLPVKLEYNCQNNPAD